MDTVHQFTVPYMRSVGITLYFLLKHLMASPPHSVHVDVGSSTVQSVHLFEREEDEHESRTYPCKRGVRPNRQSVNTTDSTGVSVMHLDMIRFSGMFVCAAYQGILCGQAACTLWRLPAHPFHTPSTSLRCSTLPLVPLILIPLPPDASLREHNLAKMSASSSYHYVNTQAHAQMHTHTHTHTHTLTC